MSTSHRRRIEHDRVLCSPALSLRELRLILPDCGRPLTSDQAELLLGHGRIIETPRQQRKLVSVEVHRAVQPRQRRMSMLDARPVESLVVGIRGPHDMRCDLEEKKVALLPSYLVGRLFANCGEF